MPEPRIVLASASPRRRQLIGLIAAGVEAIATDSDESFDPNQPPDQIASGLAVRKAIAGLAACPGALVIGADTIVVCDELVLNKPLDEPDARDMLRLLSGRDHDVFTGIAVAGPDTGHLRSGFCRSVVRFRELSESDIDEYIASGIWTDKAGAYGIQGEGGVVVESVSGCFQTVVGFPLCLVGRLVREAGGMVRQDAIPCGFRSDAVCPNWP